MMAKIFLPLSAWSSLAFIAYVTLSPLNERPEIDTYGFLSLFSHFDHYIAYAIGFSFRIRLSAANMSRLHSRFRKRYFARTGSNADAGSSRPNLGRRPENNWRRLRSCVRIFHDVASPSPMTSSRSYV
jgi:hypothetical protein